MIHQWKRTQVNVFIACDDSLCVLICYYGARLICGRGCQTHRRLRSPADPKTARTANLASKAKYFAAAVAQNGGGGMFVGSTCLYLYSLARGWHVCVWGGDQRSRLLLPLSVWPHWIYLQTPPPTPQELSGASFTKEKVRVHFCSPHPQVYTPGWGPLAHPSND